MVPPPPFWTHVEKVYGNETLPKYKNVLIKLKNHTNIIPEVGKCLQYLFECFEYTSERKADHRSVLNSFLLKLAKRILYLTCF